MTTGTAQYPRTIAEMIPARRAAMARLASLPADQQPTCHVDGHGALEMRPLECQTYEQMFCGVWFDCPALSWGAHRCGTSYCEESADLRRQQGRTP